MVSYMKKSLGSLAGYGDEALLPPAEHLAVTPHTEEGEDDCTGCSNPCSEHKEFPSYLNIEMDFPILGSVKPYGRHILIATGASDWPKKIEQTDGTLAHSLSEYTHKAKSNSWKTMITNSSLLPSYSTIPDAYDVMLLPDNVIVSNVTIDKAEDFYNIFLASPLPTKPVDINLMMRDDRLGDMQIQKNPYKNLLLLCSHRKRDKRCGITAPILAQELDHVLREKDLSEHDAIIIMVSHIGGKDFFMNKIPCIS